MSSAAPSICWSQYPLQLTLFRYHNLHDHQPFGVRYRMIQGFFLCRGSLLFVMLTFLTIADILSNRKKADNKKAIRVDVKRTCSPFNTGSNVYITRCTTSTWPSGGIGRRWGLKIPCPQGRAGSSPASAIIRWQASRNRQPAAHLVGLLVS